MRIHLAAAALALAAASCSSPVFAPRLHVEPRIAHAPRPCAIDVEHYAIDLELDPAQRSIRAACTVRFYPRGAALRTVDLDFAELAVDSVADSSGRALAYRHEGSRLSIDLTDTLEPGDSAEITVRYSGAPRAGLWFSGERDGAPTQVFTQGQCETSRCWFPCWDEPSERATSEIAVTLPPKWASIAAGELVESRELEGGGRRDLWRMAVPHPAYLTTLVAGELEVVRESWNGLPLLYAAEPAHAEWLEATFGETPTILEYLEDVTGARYPYPKYAQACVDGFPSGGMENASATTLTEICVRDELGRRDYDATGLVAHEAAHQWFGDLLTCADWSHAWLNEGFATYFSELYVEATRGTDEFRARLRDLQDEYVAADTGEDRRPHVWNVYRAPEELFFRGGQTYLGGASRLHLLRFVLGDAAFFRGIRRYVADNAGRAVVTDDLRRALEAESGLDLAPFFRQWFESPGYPEFVVDWRWDSKRRIVRVSVDQVQKPWNGTPQVFSAPVDLEIRDASGARRTRVTIDERREVFELPAPTRPVWVVFDKYGWLPKRLDVARSAQEWMALAAGDDDVNGRRDALRELGAVLAESTDESLRWKIAETVLEALRDPSPAVRCAAARAFGRVYTPPDHPIAMGLARAASSDGEARVRVAALDTLSGWENVAEFADLGREQFDAGYSWATSGAAARLVAAAEGEEALPWLEERLALRSPFDQLAAEMQAAFARIPSPRSLEIVRGFAFDEGRDEYARAAAIRVLGPLSRYRDDVQREIADLLGATRSYALQSAAIDALARLGRGRAAAALEAHHRTCLDARHRRTIERALAAAPAATP
jgi:aminopeptidase N